MPGFTISFYLRISSVVSAEEFTASRSSIDLASIVTLILFVLLGLCFVCVWVRQAVQWRFVHARLVTVVHCLFCDRFCSFRFLIGQCGCSGNCIWK